MSQIKDRDLARRRARVTASDLALYNEEKVVKGILNDDLFEALSEEIAEARKDYEERVSPEIVASENFFDLALVDVLVHNKGHIKSPIW